MAGSDQTVITAPLLSDGQQQRVALARALAIKPQALLMDEPMSNLDARLREEVRSEIRELEKKIGITVLYVTHDQVEAMALDDRTAMMDQRVILLFEGGTSEEPEKEGTTQWNLREKDSRSLVKACWQPLTNWDWRRGMQPISGPLSKWRQPV